MRRKTPATLLTRVAFVVGIFSRQMIILKLESMWHCRETFQQQILSNVSAQVHRSEYTYLTTMVKSVRVKSITILRLRPIEPDKGTTAGCIFLQP